MRDGVEAVWCGINLVTMNEKKHMFWPPQAIGKTLGRPFLLLCFGLKHQRRNDTEKDSGTDACGCVR